MNAQEMYKQEVNASLEMLKADVAELKARTEELDAEGRSRFHDYVEELDEKRAEISKQLAGFAEAGGKAKNDIERGLREAWDRLAIAKRAAEARFH